MVVIRGMLGTLLVVAGAGCSNAQGAPSEALVERTAGLPAAPTGGQVSETDRQLYRGAAEVAWRYMEAHYRPSTGLVDATPDWAYTTVWDIGGQLLAFHSARELGLLAPQEYDVRTRRTLETLEKVALFRDAAFNKVYSTRDGTAGDGKRGATGWSSTDLGRLLVALHVLAEREPQYAEQARRIVQRLDMKQIVKDGYLHGQLIGNSGKPWSFQEGRIGYEQYTAAGFERWGVDVRKAANVKLNARPVKVNGVQLLADTRKLDRLLSEPFIMMGVELGLSGDLRELAQNVLRAQEARYRQTGQITMASEDAVAVAPHYFYYYCVYCSGKPFVVEVSSPGKSLNEPRWVSTKAAYGWHALMPDDYTSKAVAHVAPARDPKQGWASGVFEKTGKSTGTFDINTAALMLELAAYQVRGADRPLVKP